MTLMYLWVYSLLLVIVWWFFVVAKIHAYKFKNFSSNIPKVTKILFIILLFLSILWYILLIVSDDNSSGVIDYKKADFNFNETNY